MAPLRLAQFIRTHLDDIVREWEAFARSLGAARSLDIDEPGDHARQMLLVIADDLDTSQTEEQRLQKSRGRTDGTSDASETPAQAHGSERATSGLDHREMVSEYRALRASVIRLWTRANGTLDAPDVEDLVRFNEGIDQALAESTATFTADLDRTRELFLGILGHDLRTPIGAIVTSAHFILELDDPRTMREMADVIVNSGDRMDRMVEDLLLVTRSRLGDTIPIEPERTDLRTVLSAAVEEIRASRPGGVIELEVEGDVTGDWDRARLSQVFNNLLANAIDHGAQRRPVTVRASGGGERVVCSVHNEGEPIPQAMLRQIFEPMATGGGRAGGDHLGLGLYIAEQIVRGHGGTITVRSGTAGTTFTVELPRRVAAGRRPAPVEPRAKQLSS